MVKSGKSWLFFENFSKVQNFIKISLLYVLCNCEHFLSKYIFEIFENLLII